MMPVLRNGLGTSALLTVDGTGRARNLQELADVKKRSFDTGCFRAGVPILVRRRSLAGLGRSATLFAQCQVIANVTAALRWRISPR